MEEILKSLEGIFQNVFADEKMTIGLETHPDEIDSWDSLRHAVLIDSIEKHFDIKFDLMEMISFNTVEDICNGISRKLG